MIYCDTVEYHTPLVFFFFFFFFFFVYVLLLFIIGRKDELLKKQKFASIQLPVSCPHNKASVAY